MCLRAATPMKLTTCVIHPTDGAFDAVLFIAVHFVYNINTGDGVKHHVRKLQKGYIYVCLEFE